MASIISRSGVLFALLFALVLSAFVAVAASQSCECPCPCDSSSGLSLTWYSGSSVWWLAVTIPGSSSVKIDCGNGQGFVSMTPGWSSNMWTFSSGNGQACKSSVQFIVNGGSAQSVTAPF
jgi:hypothetical protein